MSLVVVSNRVAKAKADEPIAGGLASALLPVVEECGAIWVGSSGRLRDASHRGYYEGFANSVLWPALHSRADLIRATLDDYRCYREVNAFMARGLLRFGRA